MNIKEDIKPELPLVPFMLGKLFGGALACIGFIGLVPLIYVRYFYKQRDFNSSMKYILLSGSLSVIGIIIFGIFNSILKKKIRNQPAYFNWKKGLCWGLLWGFIGGIFFFALVCINEIFRYSLSLEDLKDASRFGLIGFLIFFVFVGLLVSFMPVRTKIMEIRGAGKSKKPSSWAFDLGLLLCTIGFCGVVYGMAHIPSACFGSWGLREMIENIDYLIWGGLGFIPLGLLLIVYHFWKSTRI